MTTWRHRCARHVAAMLLVSAAYLPSSTSAGETVIVYAAASLTNAVNEVLDLCAGRQPDAIKASFASSSVLAKQIEHGAAAAVFLSANAAWMDYLDKRGLLAEGSRHRLMGNGLVVIAPKASLLAHGLSASDVFANLPGDGRIAMGDPDHVPAGIYAKAALEHIGAWEIAQNRAARSANARAALALVVTGAAPLGIVYATDALASRGVRIVAEFPPESHPPILYESAVVRAHDTPAADRLHLCIRGAGAARIFERHGFLRLKNSDYADAR